MSTPFEDVTVIASILSSVLCIPNVPSSHPSIVFGPCGSPEYFFAMSNSEDEVVQMLLEWTALHFGALIAALYEALSVSEVGDDVGECVTSK